MPTQATALHHLSLSGIEPGWAESLATWAKGHSEIEAVYLYGSRVSGISRRTGKEFRTESDLDVGLRLSDRVEPPLTVWICEAQSWNEEIVALRLPVTVHLELASDDDDTVWPECQRYGVCIFERSRPVGKGATRQSSSRSNSR